MVRREGNSTYRQESTDPPDTTINSTIVSDTKNAAARFGEGVTLRFTGIPRTALYSELEFEQSRVRLREDRKGVAGQSSPSSNDVFNRTTITHLQRGTGTVGARITPTARVDVTSHLRRRVYVTDYDDQSESSPGSTTAKSAFFDGQTITTNEFMTRVAYKVARWLKPALRYQFRNEDYATRAENQAITKTLMQSHIYTADLLWQPAEPLVMTGSFSRQTAVTSTPARYAAGGSNTPAFNADVNTWLLSADYTPPRHPSLALSGSAQYSVADNFNDFSAVGLPLGETFDRLDLTSGITWSPVGDSSLKAEYAFYHYNGGGAEEPGDYNAHVIWLEAAKKF